jgi:hypothetical protein
MWGLEGTDATKCHQGLDHVGQNSRMRFCAKAWETIQGWCREGQGQIYQLFSFWTPHGRELGGVGRETDGCCVDSQVIHPGAGTKAVSRQKEKGQNLKDVGRGGISVL